MTYPSTMTVWDGTETSRSAFDRAVYMAKTDDAHLDVLCLRTHYVPTSFYAADFTYDLGSHIYESALNEAKALAEDVRSMMADEDLDHTIRHIALTAAEIPVQLGNMTWPYDLMVLPKPLDEDANQSSEAVLDAVLFNGTTPILMIPAGQEPKYPHRISIAWNGSTEALRAVRSALPLLKQASFVEISMFDPPKHDANEPDTGHRLAKMLARHDIRLELCHLPMTANNIADTMMHRADEIGADMLVMGAYGHSRFRERLLGGATRDMIHAARLPVFMAH